MPTFRAQNASRAEQGAYSFFGPTLGAGSRAGASRAAGSVVQSLTSLSSPPVPSSLPRGDYFSGGITYFT
jgi:hypothetical protein